MHFLDYTEAGMQSWKQTTNLLIDENHGAEPVVSAPVKPHSQLFSRQTTFGRKKMKPIIIGIISSLIFGPLFASAPFPPQVFSEDRFSFVVGFPWPDQEKKVLVIRTIRKTSLFSLEELGIENVGYTTAGTTWYKGAIGYVERLRTTEQAIEPSYIWAFYFRNAEGKEVVIDLAESKIIDPSTTLDRAFLLELNIRKAENLLGSAKPDERRTGAIHLGQFGRPACLERLRRLLDDNSSYTMITENQEERTVFYVREAAKEAMRQIEARTNADNFKS